MMESAYFEYNGQSSTDFGLLISADLSFTSPATRGEFVTIDGEDGELFFGDGKLSNVTKAFQVYLDSSEFDSFDEQTSLISNWLKNNPHFSDLTFIGDDDYVYQAIYTDEYDLEGTLGDYGRGVITFKCKPYKYLVSGLLESQLKSTLTNTTNRIAKPKLTIKGSGNVTVKIGDSVLTIKGMDGGCVIDTLYSQATSLDGSRAIWDKITTWPLPTIAPGKQAVTVTGNVTDIRIIPRWEVIVG